MREIPAEGEGFKLEHEDRQCTAAHRTAQGLPKKPTRQRARSLARCQERDAESDSISILSCDERLRIAMPPHDVRKDVKVPRAATPAPKGKDVIPAASRISSAKVRSASRAVSKQAPQPIRLVTANGNITASEIADINIDALCEPAQPYILENSPAVLSLNRWPSHWSKKCIDPIVPLN